MIQNKINRDRIEIDGGQLTLLSMFPKFKRKNENEINKIKYGTEYLLRNLSGMLGAYGFISKDGEMMVVSARVLRQLLGHRKSFTIKELTPTIVAEHASRRVNTREQHHFPFYYPLPFIDPHHCSWCDDYFDNFIRHHRHYKHYAHHLKMHGYGINTKPDESVLSCLGMAEFVRFWTEVQLGEIIEADDRSEESNVLRNIIEAIQLKVGGKDPPNDIVEINLDEHKKGLMVLSATVNTTLREGDNRG
ncbi:MAG: hypothetical protein HQL64_15245 [Magnetococcales bacterium]|nr:hypothetical protein [Magnetococcales bacterium]